MKESIELTRSWKGYWTKKFFSVQNEQMGRAMRVSEKEAIESIKLAREQKEMFSDGGGEDTKEKFIIFGYWN